MQEIRKMLDFFGTKFGFFSTTFFPLWKKWYFLDFLHVSSVRRFLELFTLLFDSHPIAARPRTARHSPEELCRIFTPSQSFSLRFLMDNHREIEPQRKLHVNCQVYSDRGCLRKPCVALTHTMKIWNFENLLNLNFWVPKIGPDALIRDPSPARAGTSRKGGLSIFCNRRRRPRPCPSRLWLSGHVCSGPEPHVVAFHLFLFKKAVKIKSCEGVPPACENHV